MNHNKLEQPLQPQKEKKKPERQPIQQQKKQQQQKQQPPQIPQKKEKEKPKRPPIQPQKKQPIQPPKQVQKKQQQQQQEIKADDKEEKGKTALSDEDNELFGKFEDKYKFKRENQRAGAVVTRVDNDIIFVRKIPTGTAGYAKYKNGPYLILKTNAEKFKKFINNEVSEGMADDDEEEDDIIFDYFNFSNKYFKDNEKKFADSLKKKKFLFDKLDVKLNYFGWNEFKRLDIIPGIKKKETYIDRLKDFNVETIQDNIFVKREAAKKKERKDLFGINDEEPLQENEEEPLPKDVKIEDDIDNSEFEGMIDTDEEAKPQGFDEDDNIQEVNTGDLKQQQQQQQRKQRRQHKQLIQSQNNQLINAGHTPNGEELKALIKYNNNSDSLLKLIVNLSNDNKGEVDFKEIGEIQDLNGDITNLYSDMQDLKSKINSSDNEEEKERLLIKYNKKRLKLEDLIKKYSKEAYRLSTLNKKKKATFSNPKYIKNKLSKL